MSNRRTLKILDVFLVILLLFGGFLIQIGVFNNKMESNPSQISEKNHESLTILSDPDLKLQWSFNTNAYSSLDSQIKLEYTSISNVTNLYNCSISPEATIEALSQFSDGSIVNITAVGDTTEFYADCYINLSYPTEFLEAEITQMDIIAFMGINVSLQTSQMQLYNNSGTLFDKFTSIETTPQNKTISILSNFQDYLGGADNLTIRFYANDTAPIQANITIDGIVVHVYYDIKIHDLIWGVAAGDGNGDNQLDLAVVGENGTLFCLNGINGSLLWNYYLSGPTYSVAFGDIDANGQDEVIATRIISPGPFPPKTQNITVFDFDTHLPISEGYSLESLSAVKIVGVGAGDIRNNSKDEVLFLDNQGFLYVFDGETDIELKKVIPLGVMIPFGGGSNQGFDINFGDVDDDGILEFIVSGIDGAKKNGSTSLHSWQDGDVTRIWEFKLNASAYCSIADFGDIDGDGEEEVVVGSRQNNLIPGGEVFLLKGETSDVIWSFNTGSNSIYDISCGDIHNDGRDEIAVAVGGNLNMTYILEGENNSIVWSIPSAYAITGVELVDINNDGKCEIVTIGNEFVNLYCFDTDGDGTTDMDDLDDDNDNITDIQEVSLYGTNPFYIDSDHDNLSDTAELFAHGTNPNWWDTDNDGLSDWMEINIYHTNPNDPNSDNDYLNDGEEIQLGLDPNDPDSDDDGYLDGEEKRRDDWLFYLFIILTCVTAIILAMNVRYFLTYRRREYAEDITKRKAGEIRKRIKDAVWFWGHGSHVLKNLDKLITKDTRIITLEALTRTWTQHYKKTFQKIFKLSEEEAGERAEAQKKKEILELYNLLQEKIEIKLVPITFGKYAGSDSYQFEIWSDESEKSQKQKEKEEKQKNDQK